MSQVAKKMSVTVGVRCHSPLLALLDKYRRSEPDIPTRAAALRRLAIAALKDKVGVVEQDVAND
jgi:hypothetical protein